MATITLTLVPGQTASPPVGLPMATPNWQVGGVSCLMNFSGGGPAVAGTGGVTLQVSNDPNANPNNTPAQINAARWNAHDVLNAVTGDRNSSIVFPVVYARLIGAVASGTVACQIGLPDGYGH